MDHSHGPSGDRDEDLVRAALADAQRLARSRGRANVRRRRRPVERGEPRRRGGYSGPAPDDTDPQRLGAVLGGYVEDRGWQRPIAEAQVFADWESYVGADVAAHCRPVSLREGELHISAESTAWATQLRLLAATMLARLAERAGQGLVRKLVITGPTAPSWKHGAFSVRGARGPRDTYG